MNEHPSREYIRQINGLKILINEDLNDDESEWGYYNSRCRKGHSYECARGASFKYCEDFEKE